MITASHTEVPELIPWPPDLPDAIPTTAAIAEAKKRRERMRAEGVQDGANEGGFISLEVGFASKSGESRLVREDDEIGDGDEGEFPSIAHCLDTR